MSVTLVALSEGPNLTLDKPVVLLGRHEECDVQLNSGKVSRRHCVIAWVDEKIIIRDLGSTNGVLINGERVPEGPLNNGDEVAIGNFCYRVRFDTGDRPKLEDEALEAADEPIALGEDGELPDAESHAPDTATKPEI